MQKSEINLPKLRKQVEADFLGYADAYQPAAPDATMGTPWPKEKVRVEVEKALASLVEPYFAEYFSGDELLPPAQRRTGVRSAFVVAHDGDYFLLFDYDAEDFVLACEQADGRLSAWGIRGDATSTFLAR